MAGFAFRRRRYHFPLREPLFLLIFLSVMLYLFLSEWFVKGMTAGAIKG